MLGWAHHSFVTTFATHIYIPAQHSFGGHQFKSLIN